MNHGGIKDEVKQKISIRIKTCRGKKYQASQENGATREKEQEEEENEVIAHYKELEKTNFARK
jgi:hypothetical protein